MAPKTTRILKSRYVRGYRVFPLDPEIGIEGGAICILLPLRLEGGGRKVMKGRAAVFFPRKIEHPAHPSP